MKQSTTSLAVIEKLYDFMSRYGLPHTLVSDNGTAFVSSEFQNFCNLNGITQVTSPAYHAASNGQAESCVKVVKKGIKSCLLSSRNQKETQNKLFKFLFDYRNSVHSTTGAPPAQLVFGHKLRTRLDVLLPSAATPSVASLSPASLTDYVKNKQCLQAKYYGSTNLYTFKENDKVLHKKILLNNKFEWRKGIIVRKLGKVLYLVKDLITKNVYKKHKDQIILYKGNTFAIADDSVNELALDDMDLTSSDDRADTYSESFHEETGNPSSDQSHRDTELRVERSEQSDLQDRNEATGNSGTYTPDHLCEEWRDAEMSNSNDVAQEVNPSLGQDKEVPAGHDGSGTTSSEPTSSEHPIESTSEDPVVVRPRRQRPIINYRSFF